MLRIRPIVVGHGSGSFLRHLRDCELDSVIGAASAKISAQPATNLFRTRVWMLIDKRLERDHEPGSTETALRSVVIDECLLNGVEIFALHQGFDRGDCLALRFDGQNRAGIDSPVIQEHSASAALGTIAHPLGASDVKRIAERVQQSDRGSSCKACFWPLTVSS